MKKEDFKRSILDRWDIDIEEKDNYRVHEEKYWFTCNVCHYKWKQLLRLDRNLSCPNCHPYHHGSSRGEMELYDLLLTTGLNIVNNNRTVLDGKEIDIYFPDIKFGIEYDGKHWHNEKDDKLKDQLCKEKGIYLIRVDNYDFCKDREPIINNILKILKEKYGLDVEVHPEKVREVIRTSEKCRKIICTDTMEIFDSYLHAEKAMRLSSIEILSVCNGNRPNLHGYHFQYYNKDKIYTQTERGYEFKYKRVKCIETNEVFLSINAAIKVLSSIQDVLYENQKTAGGLHWEYTDDQPTDTTKTETLINEYLKTFTRKKAVICLDDGKIFDSCTEASKYYGIYEAGITRCCVGDISQTHNYHFQYVDEPHPFVQKEIEYKKVVCDDLGIVFNSVKEAKEYFNAPNENTISRVCRGERKAYKGHKLRYEKN